ncbi:hypothetical protein P691DRAFT_761484 [Macrolepiota fuliginosa MF-IS2]|uniref:Uncharacterized protein n=1 Tax=Macrolepiota fuliginosa MF-IS2 TaxID=1400762 RepID=A0A9P5X8I8_9AGAR|nr:hypothetical protein P691DRAFT_761484 [Macrolepiota fuliginosa MF-IS2]
MQTRRAHAVSPLAIVLPHPPIPRHTPSLLSLSSAASPRTPRSCGSPRSSIFVTPAANRKSTDSWNSSNADELEWEWKPEQILLLARTLDALPAHLVTPFNGPIPPSNLLDKIARGVSQAKGPVEWPHSLRATRVKLIELSRQRAKEQAVAEQREGITEEPENALNADTNYSYIQDGLEKPVGIASGTRRPLYRQSSMDFMLNAVGTDIKNNENIARLSSRLQRTERQATHHPYQRSTRSTRCTSPPPSTVPSLINPSTPSSSTLNTLSSFSSQPRALRRTISSVSSSSLSILSSSSDGILPNPRVQRLMQDDGFAPVVPHKDSSNPGKAGVKRAPSFGAFAQESRREYLTQTPPDNSHVRKNSCPSSDEEEKLRNKQAKKPRKQSTPFGARATPPPESPAPTTPVSSPIIIRKRAPQLLPEANLKGSGETKSEGKERAKEKKENFLSLGKSQKVKHSTKPLPMNLQRNPSIFGPELPQVTDVPMSPAPMSPRAARGLPSSPAPRALSSLKPALGPSSPSASPVGKPTSLSPAADINVSPTTQKVKTLRRVRRLAPARRISFSSLVPPGDEADADGEGDGEEKGGRIELGSAFQLH